MADAIKLYMYVGQINLRQFIFLHYKKLNNFHNQCFPIFYILSIHSYHPQT